MSEAGPPPGYYDDPSATARYRWWTGTSWSDATTDELPRPTDATGAPASALPPPAASAAGPAGVAPPGAAAPVVPPGSPAASSGATLSSGGPFVLAAGAATVVCWLLVLADPGGLAPVGLLGLVTIALVWRTRYRRRAGVWRESARRFAHDVKADWEHGNNALYRMHTPYNPYDPHWRRPEKQLNAWWVLSRTAVGIGWLLLCASWFPVRDAVATLRGSDRSGPGS